jgi:hypothetical protein
MRLVHGSTRCRAAIEKVKDIDGWKRSLLTITDGVGGWWWSGCTGWSIDKSNDVVTLRHIFNVCVVCRESLRVVVGAVFLLVLALGFLLLVELALVLLIFRDA